MVLKTKLTVYFDAPFWVGVYERLENQELSVCRIVFGSEPKDYEVYDFLLKNFFKLRFSKPIKADGFADRKINPKRLQRQIKKETQNKGIGTKAQQAIKLEHESRKIEHKKMTKAYKEALKEEKYLKRVKKKKEKKKGH